MKPGTLTTGSRLARSKVERAEEMGSVAIFVLHLGLSWAELGGTRLPPMGALVRPYFSPDLIESMFSEFDHPHLAATACLDGEGERVGVDQSKGITVDGTREEFAMFIAATRWVALDLNLPRSEAELFFGPPVLARPPRRARRK
jgi:hypothetical protein